MTNQEFDAFRTLIYNVAGISLSPAKRQLVQSRLQKRLRALNLETYSEYYAIVANEPDSGDERREFINCLTTNKTDFYRESHHFDFIQKELLPHIQRTESPRELKIWHAGCSTGEEPYTLGIVLAEWRAKNPLWSTLQLATDIDTNVLRAATEGIYSEESVKDIPAALLARYFAPGRDSRAGQYRVREELRNAIRFRRLNLMENPWPFRAQTKFDFIMCRNVLIYFDKPTQARLIQRYTQYLRPGGYLFLGHSESMSGTDMFRAVGRTIFRYDEENAVAA